MTIFETWTKHRPYLLEAISQTNGTHNEDDIIVGLMQGVLRLWQSEHGAIITEIVNYPRMKAVNFFLVGAETGYLHELFDVEQQIIGFAKSQGCTRITGAGRPGWNRVLKEFKVAGSLMYKDIA